jgi:hypothetical protein
LAEDHQGAVQDQEAGGDARADGDRAAGGSRPAAPVGGITRCARDNGGSVTSDAVGAAAGKDRCVCGTHRAVLSWSTPDCAYT